MCNDRNARKQVGKQARKSFGWTKIGEIIDVALKYHCGRCPVNKCYCQKTNEQTFKPFPNPQGELAFGHMNNATIAGFMCSYRLELQPTTVIVSETRRRTLCLAGMKPNLFLRCAGMTQTIEASGVSQLLGRVAYTC